MDDDDESAWNPPVEDLERLADYYDTHDTSAEMEHGQWIEPRANSTGSANGPSVSRTP